MPSCVPGSTFTYCAEHGSAVAGRYPLGSAAMGGLMAAAARMGTLLHGLRAMMTRLSDGAGMVACNLAASVGSLLDAHEVRTGLETVPSCCVAFFSPHNRCPTNRRRP